jgi:YidC/Oxa1 family membrane protein insertase
MIFANVIENAFSPLITLFEGIMVFIHDNIVGGSWGLAIIGLTVVIRAVLVPLTFRQLKSMQEMQRLAPQIQALKEKYKEDKQRQQQELMKFYQENKINPLASCLPLLLQIPVFISLFYMLRTDLKFDICGPQMKIFYTKELGRPIVKNSQVPEHAVTGVNGQHVKGISELGCSQIPGAAHSAKFLFIPDITLKATGVALVVLIVLYVGSQLGSTLIATASADPTQRRLMLFLPLVFVIILFRYPAGLFVYWITTNFWTIGQQYLIKRHMGPVTATGPPASQEAEGKKPRSILRPALVGSGSSSGGGGGGTGGAAPAASDAKAEKGAKPDAKPASKPPPPPRKKRKRSGRRR